MKCRVCRGPAVIDIRRHNANFCPEHFLKLCRDQTAKAIKQFSMLDSGDQCPMAVGNKHLTYKAALNDIERDSPGAKHDFFFRFLDQAAERFRSGDGGGDAEPDVNPCRRCGAPTSNEVCSFCALVGRATEVVPIEMGRSSEQKTVAS